MGIEKKKILLFGVSNVGKTTIGEILGRKLGIPFYDLDEEIRNWYQCTQIEFIKSGTYQDRDAVRARILEELLKKAGPMVVAVSPITCMDLIYPLLEQKDVFALELIDAPENIFDRLVFTDDNNVEYDNKAYAEKHKKAYLKEIKEDLDWYGQCNEKLPYHFDLQGRNAEEASEALIQTYQVLWK